MHKAVKVLFFSSMCSVYIPSSHGCIIHYCLHSKELTQYSKTEILSNFIYLGLFVFFFPTVRIVGMFFYLGFNTELGEDSGVSLHVLCSTSTIPQDEHCRMQ